MGDTRDVTSRWFLFFLIPDTSDNMVSSPPCRPFAVLLSLVSLLFSLLFKGRFFLLLLLLSPRIPFTWRSTSAAGSCWLSLSSSLSSVDDSGANSQCLGSVVVGISAAEAEAAAPVTLFFVARCLPVISNPTSSSVVVSSDMIGRWIIMTFMRNRRRWKCCRRTVRCCKGSGTRRSKRLLVLGCCWQLIGDGRSRQEWALLVEMRTFMVALCFVRCSILLLVQGTIVVGRLTNRGRRRDDLWGRRLLGQSCCDAPASRVRCHRPSKK
jgi:hypothetical protein